MNPEKSLCIFGTSISYGAYDYEKGGWVNRLRLYLDSKDSDIEVYNLGITGETTEGMVKRFEVEAEAREPGVIIIDVGINDAAFIRKENRHNVAPDRFENNLEILIDKAKKFDSSVVFKLPTNVDESKTDPIPWRPEFSYLNADIGRYKEIIKRAALHHGLKCFEVSPFSPDELSDGLHPNTAGHEKIFQAVKALLEKEKILPS